MSEIDRLVKAYLAGMTDAASLVRWRHGPGTDQEAANYVMDHILKDGTTPSGETAEQRARHWAIKHKNS